MARNRDVAAFDKRAPRYDVGWLGRVHHEIADRTLDLALAEMSEPRRVLDIGCGTGYLLCALASRLPSGAAFVGVDAAPSMIGTASRTVGDARVHFAQAMAEHLPLPSASFDLVVSTTSFNHWADQPAGLAECARVLTPGGRLVLVDQFSAWLRPTLVGGRRRKARTRRRASRLLTEAGLSGFAWHDVYAAYIRAAVATR